MGFEASLGSGSFTNLIDPTAGDHHFPSGPPAGFASNDRVLTVEPNSATGEQCHFEVYRADSVRLTTTRFGGGDWRWRLCSHDGRALVEAEGYRTESKCREAVAILRSCASLADSAD
jgi:uncharacterized protein YegP (UPF0339 family)